VAQNEAKSDFTMRELLSNPVFLTFCFKTLIEASLLSTKVALSAPRLKASSPNCPEPAKRSSMRLPSISNCIALKRPYLTLSGVGRTTSLPGTVIRRLPLAVPVIIRIYITKIKIKYINIIIYIIIMTS